jgi:hypothetical protein
MVEIVARLDFSITLSTNNNNLFDYLYLYICRCINFDYQYFQLFIIKIYKIIYFENTNQDKSNNISYANFCIYILEEKYSQIRTYE